MVVCRSRGELGRKFADRGIGTIARQEMVRAESWYVLAKVIRRILQVSAQETCAEWGPCHHSDVQLTGGWNNIGLGIPGP